MSDGGPLSDDAEQKNRRQWERDARRQHKKDLVALMAHPTGRRIVWWLVNDLAAAYGRSHTGDPISSAFNEGKREVGITLMETVQRAAPNECVEMLKERFASIPPAPRDPDEDGEKEG